MRAPGHAIQPALEADQVSRSRQIHHRQRSAKNLYFIFSCNDLTVVRDACREAGVPGSAHGLRKLGATRAADNGATESELEAIFGWTGGHMAVLYTRSANRRRLSLGAMHKLDGAVER
jgi:integrase